MGPCLSKAVKQPIGQVETCSQPMSTTDSLHLSSVMSDIGVNEEIVRARRKACLTRECEITLVNHLNNKPDTKSYYIFGSQTEGTTTVGLHSDIDKLIRHDETNIIDDISEWQNGLKILLLVKDATMSPGYRCLGKMCSERPARLQEIPYYQFHLAIGDDGYVYVPNTHLHNELFGERHGPANTTKGEGGYPDIDIVDAYFSPHWPVEASEWYRRTMDKQWPTENMKKRILESGCFVVPVGHKETNSKLHYRLSTSLAERILMFSFNITQVRCLVLLKMLMKTYINSEHGDCMKSYYSKTALFYLIEEHGQAMWREDNILTCIELCLNWLSQCVKANEIPHYFMPSLNMFEGRLHSRTCIVEAIQPIIENPLQAIMTIDFDQIGARMDVLCNNARHENLKSAEECKMDIARGLWNNIIIKLANRETWYYGQHINTLLAFKSELEPYVDNCTQYLDSTAEMANTLTDLTEELFNFNGEERYCMRNVIEKMNAFVSSILGRVIASEQRLLTDRARQLLETGCESDAVSGRLKYATVLYSTGDLSGCLSVLQKIVVAYDTQTIEPVCKCGYMESHERHSNGFLTRYFGRINTNTLHNYCAYCIVFTDNMQHSIPSELRSIFVNDQWIYHVTVDALPYLYFLLYMTYRRTDSDTTKQAGALDQLEACMGRREELHHETADLILLGQCLELENRTSEAEQCYIKCLTLRDIRGSYTEEAKHLLHQLQSKKKPETAIDTTYEV